LLMPSHIAWHRHLIQHTLLAGKSHEEGRPMDTNVAPSCSLPLGVK
jgi:hypothetical protein